MKYTFSIYYKKCPEGYCPNYPLEQELDAMAQVTGGEEVGSGMMLSTGERDVQYIFENKLAAINFQEFLDKEHDWIDNITELEEYPY
jgi:hypothetical protein